MRMSTSAVQDRHPVPASVNEASLDGERLLRLVEAASRAPSSHNTQPWRFQLRPSAIELLADRSRALPHNDPADRELTISCGAALFNLRVAAAHDGLHETVNRGSSADHLATLLLSEADIDSRLAALYDQIDRRRTHHGPFEEISSPGDELLAHLVRAAEDDGAHLVPVDADRRAGIVALVREGDRRQFADSAWRRELAEWMHRPGDHDGLSVPVAKLPITRLAVSHLDLGRTTAVTDADLVEHAPIVAVVTTDGDSVDDWLRAGQALQRVALVATAAGMDLGFANQPCQVAQLRPRLQALLGSTDHPQLVIRVGPSATTRPPLRRRPPTELIADDAPPQVAPIGRRSFLHRAALGIGTALVAADATVAYRAYDQGVMAEGDGPAFDAWKTWRERSGPEALVAAAILAANGHNSQPWLFDLRANQLHLRADLSRTTGANDALDREMHVSLGCAIENMMIAAPANGLLAQLRTVPDPADDGLVATVTFQSTTPVESDLYPAIGERHSNRSEYRNEPVPQSMLNTATALVDESVAPARLIWLTDRQARDRFGQMIIDATAAYIADDEQSLASFAWWRSDWNEIQRRKDGLNIDGVGLPPLVRTLGKILPAPSRASADRTFLDRTRIQVRSAAAFGIIVVDDALDRRQQLAGGRLLQRLHLWATSRRIGFQHMNQVTERIDRDRQLGRASPFSGPLEGLAGTTALSAFRIGTPTVASARSPRRPAVEVIR